MDVQLNDMFKLKGGLVIKVAEIFSVGLNYHTYNTSGDCVRGQQYKTKSDFSSLSKGERP